MRAMMRKPRFHPCGDFRQRYEEELTIFETDFGRVWLVIGLLALFVVIPLVCKAYWLYIINLIGIAAIAAIGLNILIGFTGQISLGHGAFFGVGAYSAAILASSCGFPFYLSVLSAGVITAFVGMVFGIPSLRLKHLYLTIATLAGQFIIEYLLVHWTGLTKGTGGDHPVPGRPCSGFPCLRTAPSFTSSSSVSSSCRGLRRTSYGPGSAARSSPSATMTGPLKGWAFPFSSTSSSRSP